MAIYYNIKMTDIALLIAFLENILSFTFIPSFERPIN